MADFEAMQLAAARLGDRVKEGEALCNQAGSHWWRFSEAHKGLVEKCAREAMVIANETGDERIQARGLYSLGMVDQKAGKLREADAKLLRSRRDLPPEEPHRPAGDRPHVAEALARGLARRASPSHP